MKKLAIMMLASALSLAAADYSGIWSGKGGKEDSRYGTVPATAQMTLLQAGSSLSGTIKLGNGKPVKITSGNVSGNHLSVVLAMPNGQVTGSLTQTGAQLAGKMTASNGEVYDFVFTKD
jgi:ABC-type phosphate/phosphonate transport system substrate-binding protein